MCTRFQACVRYNCDRLVRCMLFRDELTDTRICVFVPLLVVNKEKNVQIISTFKLRLYLINAHQMLVDTFQIALQCVP